MFWKRKKSKPSGTDPFNLQFDEGPRYYFRVTTSPGKPLRFQVGSRFYPVEDISAGGMGLRGQGLLNGQRLAGLLYLPDEEMPVPLILVLCNVSPTGLMGGQFTKIKEQDRERIHQYVLARQKEELEEQRKLEEKLAARKPED